MKHALKELPPDLDQTYDNILLSVQPGDQELLRKALQFVVFSARPMHVREVAEAVIVESGTSQIDEDDRLQRPEDLLDIGKSLFIQDHTRHPTKQFLELSHYSVKEYLLSERIKKGQAAVFAIDKTQAELENATCLLTYLGLDVFEEAWRVFDAETTESADRQEVCLDAEFLTQQHEQRVKEFPLLLYAAQTCFSHHCSSEAVQHAVAPLIRKSFSLSRSGRFRNMTYTCVYNPLDLMASYGRLYRYSLIAIAARWNLSVVVQDLLAAGIPVDYLPFRPKQIEPHPEGQTALYRAADFGHKNLCKILIDAGASVQGTTNDDCPLSAAARSGNAEIVRLMLEAGADATKDAKPLSVTQLAIWWRYVEAGDDSKWHSILEILRDASSKWSTIGLLAAFSKSIKPLVNNATEVLRDDSIGDSWTQSEKFEYIVEEMDINTLNALQWLAQDEAGTAGLKASLETTMQAIYDSQPHLFSQDTRYAAQKFSAEEVVAENLIHVYFRLAPKTSDQVSPISVAQQSKALLDALWDNVSLTRQPKSFRQADASTENRLPLEKKDWLWEAEGLIVYGEILRAWARARWEDAYAHFFD